MRTIRIYGSSDDFDEDKPLPDWPMRWSVHERGYSVQLEIDAPEGVVISREGKAS